MQLKRYTFNLTEITSIAIDTYVTDILWMAFKKDEFNVCSLYKVSANNLYQVYSRIDLSVEEITAMRTNEAIYLAVAVNGDYLGYIFDVRNPSSIQGVITKPAGILEYPIDVTCDTTYAYFLLPGNISGENAKVIKYRLSTRAYITTIDLSTINNAISIVNDTNSNLWIITNNSPSELIRIYDDGGYQIQTTILTP